MRPIRFLILTLAVCILAAIPALAENPIVIKFTHVVAVDTPKGQAAELISALSFEIPDEESRIQFKKEMLKLLKQL